MDIEDCKSFPDYLKMSQEVSDKVGFLTTCFRRLHTNSPKEDLTNLGGRIAQLWVLCHKDTGYFLKIIWNTSSENPCGSHLNYIQAIIKKTDRINPLSKYGNSADSRVDGKNKTEQIAPKLTKAKDVSARTQERK